MPSRPARPLAWAKALSAGLWALACMAPPSGAALAADRRVRLEGLQTRFRPGGLGGITRVIRFQQVRPDRTDIAWVFMTEGAGPRALPQEVQVIGRDDRALHLADSEADCVLQRVRLRRHGAQAEVISAVRIFNGDLARTVNSEAAPMEISVFRTAEGEAAGDSAVVLRLVSPPRRTLPLCRGRDVDREMLHEARSGGR